MSDAYPKVKIEIDKGMPDRLINAFEAGLLDLLITAADLAVKDSRNQSARENQGKLNTMTGQRQDNGLIASDFRNADATVGLYSL